MTAGRPPRQRAFITALAETGCVTRACARVGMSTVGAYQMRKAPGGEEFAAAWEEALAHGVERLSDIAYERAVHGITVPVFFRGEQIGEKRWYDNRLLMWVMRHRDPRNYGGPIGNRVPPHIREALHAEWRAAEDAKQPTGESAREWLSQKLEQMHQRLKAAGQLDHLYPERRTEQDGEEA